MTIRVKRKGGVEDASDQARHLRQPQSRNASDASRSELAIDLPLKILIWEDGEGKVWVSYNSLAYLQERHGLPKELLQNIAVVETLTAAIAE
jgi:uncharacterized protein (DUF302 family)